MTESSLPTAVLRPLRDVNTFEATVEHLAATIRLGVFADGEQLPPERELAARLGISRVTLREAISALRQAGMVQTRRGRGGGTEVTYGSATVGVPADRPALRQRSAVLFDALQFRRVVEPGAAALAASQDLSADQRGWLVAAEVEVRRAAAGQPHRVADSRLHLAVATVSGSAMLLEAVMRARSLLEEMLAAIPVLPRNIEHSHAEHRQVVQAVLAGDAAAAAEVMRAHCDATAALVRGLIA